MKAVYQVFSLDLIAKIFLGFATVALIRYVPEQQYANYTLALSLVSVVTQGYVAAFNRVYIVSYDELGLGTDESGFLAAQLLGVACLAVIGAPFFRDLGGTYVAAAILALATVLAEYAKTRFQRERRFMRFSAVDVSRSLLFLVLVVCAILLAGTGMRASYALVAQAVSMAVVFHVAYDSRHLRTDLRLRRSLALWRVLLSGAEGYLFAYFVILAGFAQMDVFMLKVLSDTKQLASFGSSFRYYALLLLALGAVNTVLLPAVHRAKTEGGLADLIRQQNRLLLVFVPAVALGAWMSGWLIPLIDQGRYPAAVPVFRILCASAVISLAFSPYANLIISERLYRFLVGLASAALVIGIGIEMILVPRYGAVGAAAGQLVAFGLLNTGAFLRARRSLRSLALETSPG